MPLSGYDKAAVFLSSIGEETAAEILRGLDIKEIGEITAHMTRMRVISRAELEGIFKEIAERATKGEIRIGGGEFLKKVLSKGLGEDSANKILELASKENTLNSLRWVDPKTLSNFLMTEHPQTIALILCLLEPMQSAEVLSALPEALKSDVSIRIAAMERIPADAIEELEEVLRGQLDVNKGKGRRVGGVRTIAEILNQCDRSTEQMILEKIESQNNVLSDSIRQLMFVFEDIVNVDDRAIQMILKEISTDELSLALKTASSGLKEKIFKNMTQRSAQMLKEEMDARGPVKVSEVEKAQLNFVKVARKLEAEGKIVLTKKGGEEVVV